MGITQLLPIPPGQGGYTFGEVRRDVAAQVAATNSAAFNQRAAGQTANALTESSVPLSVVHDSTALAHLLYSVHVVRCPSLDQAQARNHGGLQVKCAPEIMIQLMYRLRPGSQIIDEDLASECARVVCGSVMRIPYIEVFNEIYRPRVTPDGEYQLIEQVCTAVIDLQL